MSAHPAYPAGFPPSMPAGSHEMRDYYSNQDPPRFTPHTAPSITPYLGLRARLSQIWINRWTVLLLLVLARTLIAISGLNNDLASARREALSACSSVESMGSAMASMPHYMSQGVNEMAATGVEKSVNALMQTTTLSVTAVEEIVVFVVGMMTNTYLCLITMAVSGSLHSVINVVDSAQKGVSNLTQNIGNDIDDVLDPFMNSYNSLLSQLSKVTTLLSVPAPQPVNLTTQIDSLKNLQLPSGLSDDLQKLNNSIPDFSQVKNFTDNVIRLPFEEVKKLINESLGNYTFDKSTFPVPEKQQLTFCSGDQGINDFFDNLVNLANTARKIFIGVLILAAILVCVPMAYREIRRWRLMQERSQLVRSDAQDPMDVVYIVSRPYTAAAGIKVAKAFPTTRRQNLVRWAVAYATSDAALFVLALAIAGLFSCLCQLILLKSVEKEVPALTNQVSAFADQVVTQLNNASEQWAIGTNDVIDKLNTDINTNMLGWVNTSTTAVNDTLNTFVNMTMNVLNTTFGGTILYDPILEVLDCLLLLKVTGIENALTWVHDNAHVDFPTLPNNTFSLGAVESIASNNSSPSDSFLSSPGDPTTDQISSVVARFINAAQDAIKTEAIIATVILVIWLLMVFVGIGRAFFLWNRHDKIRGEGGPEVTVPGSYPSNIAPTMQFRSDNQDQYRTEFPGTALGIQNARPFTPAPEYTEPKVISRVIPEEEAQYQDSKLGFTTAQETAPNFSRLTMNRNGSTGTPYNEKAI